MTWRRRLELLCRNPRRLSDAPTMLTTLRLPTGPVFGPTSEILVLLTPTEQHAHGRIFLETVWLFLLTSNLVASSFHQLAGRCRQRRMSNFWLGDETAVPFCTLAPTSSLVRLSVAPNTEFVDLRLYDWCFLPEYQLDLFDSPPTCWVSTEAARPLQRHTWLACRSQRVQFLVRWWTARPKQAMTSLVPVAMVPSPRPLVSHRTRRAMGSRGLNLQSTGIIFAAATNAGPLSERISAGVPCRATNRLYPNMTSSVDMVCTSCKFTALVVAHTKRRIQTFLLLSNTFATNGPAWSIPTTENGRWSETLSCGRGAETSIPEGASKRRLYTGFLSFEQCVYTLQQQNVAVRMPHSLPRQDACCFHECVVVTKQLGCDLPEQWGTLCLHLNLRAAVFD